MKRTNVMLTVEQHSFLSALARREGCSLGEKIRAAIDSLYKEKDPVERKKDAAMLAYQEGFISLGKLAETLGLDPHSARVYLKSRGIGIKTLDRQDIKKDAANA